MESSFQWIGILGFVFWVFILVWAVRTVRRRNEAKKQLRARLGFVEVLNPDAELSGRMAALTHSGRTIHKAYKRDEGHHIIYDCDTSSTRSRHNTDRRISALVIPGVDLPAFRMTWLPVKSGVFSGLVTKATQLVIRGDGFSEIDTSFMPDFSAKYLLAARDPERVRAEIPSHIWREIMALSNYLHINAEADAIVFEMDTPKSGSVITVEEKRLTEVVKVGSALGRILKSIQREAAYSFGR